MNVHTEGNKGLNFLFPNTGTRVNIWRIKGERRFWPISRGDAMIFKMLIADKPL